MLIITVSVLFKNENDEYLLFQRGLDNAYCPGQYHSLSGKMREGEELEEALRREVFEETEIKEFEITKRYPSFDTTLGEDEYIIYLFEAFIPKDTEIVLDREHEECVWVHRDCIRDMDITPGVAEDLEYIEALQ